jgi:hypothetical protein
MRRNTETKYANRRRIVVLSKYRDENLKTSEKLNILVMSEREKRIERS